MSIPRLGHLQHRIMQILWQHGRATAREITDALNQTGFVAHSTVQTLLRQLERKGAAAHKAQDRTFVYYPLAEENKITRSTIQELVDRVFGGSATSLVAYLLKQEQIPATELGQIRKLILENDLKTKSSPMAKKIKPSLKSINQLSL